MNPNNDEDQISFRDQLKKFTVKSLLGFQTILLFGIGQRLGIFEYLHNKATTSSEGNEISSINFTPDDLALKLGLDPIYLDGWLHMAIECGMFELDYSCKKCIKTAPFIYYLLVDKENLFYIGNFLHGYYYMAVLQDPFVANFKTGENFNPFELPDEIKKVTQRMSAGVGVIIERVFSENYEGHKDRLDSGGLLLEVGCGFGFNLENWAKKYPNSKMVGIDIDPQAVEHANQIIDKHNWKPRLEILCTEISDYSMSHSNEFDVIVLNQVLHEMDTKENYRQKVFQNLYTLLKDDGLLIVGEHMIPDIYAPNQAKYYEIMHKWFEVGIGSHFYDEESFRQFIKSTPFQKAELIQDGRDYLWAVSKS
jgi:SAM-dependent methyltransferase